MVHIFGIRHHGPGSAHSLKKALGQLQPDIILVEGPPDAAEVLSLLAHDQMKPPVALLIYRPDELRHAVYYPFAAFSPELQAIRYAQQNEVPVRFMDLPMAHQFALQKEAEEAMLSTLSRETGNDLNKDKDKVLLDEELLEDAHLPPVRRDPLRWLAQAAGYNDSERWWEHMVEQRRDGADLFAGIQEAMTVLRETVPQLEDGLRDEQEVLREEQREAFMRQTIRAAQKEGFERIAVVCGAWHAPALATMPPAKEDAATLKALPKVKVQATWVPWTYSRLCFAGGYGAGVESPGWYHHLWSCDKYVTARWMTRVARLLRKEDIDASSAHVIEAVRLADTLAALRGRPLPGLPEINEAIQAVFCFGGDAPLQLIHNKLIVGERLGAVPETTPMVPLQQDLLRLQKTLRLKAEAHERVLDLDQRKPSDLARSHLLHRLNLLDIPWGKFQASATGVSTFHEIWRLQWQPEYSVALIEAGVWGNTVRAAAAALARDAADKAQDLPALTELLSRVLLCDVPETVEHLMARLQAEAAVASDIAHLMASLPPLANVLRYGDVRGTDTSAVARVMDGIVARIAVGLPAACSALNDDAAAAMTSHIGSVQGVLSLLQNQEHRALWHDALQRIADGANIHGLIAGRACRILLDGGVFDSDETARRLSLALSSANEPAQAAAWVEGFLQGSGLLLLHDDALWNVLDGWLCTLSGETFTQVLPLLRRTFATFHAPERRQMGERVKRQKQATQSTLESDTTAFDAERGALVFPLVARLLGAKPS